jgi:hypothetical protein
MCLGEAWKALTCALQAAAQRATAIEIIFNFAMDDRPSGGNQK